MSTVSKTVRLGELDHDPVIMAMPGQADRLKGLDDLAASIPAHGLLQSLKVRNNLAISMMRAGRRDEGRAQFESLLALRRDLPQLEVFDIAGAGHMGAGDRNDVFDAGVVGFLARHLPQA